MYKILYERKSGKMMYDPKCPKTDDKEVLKKYLLEQIDYLIYMRKKKKSKDNSSTLPNKSNSVHNG